MACHSYRRRHTDGPGGIRHPHGRAPPRWAPLPHRRQQQRKVPCLHRVPRRFRRGGAQPHGQGARTPPALRRTLRLNLRGRRLRRNGPPRSRRRALDPGVNPVDHAGAGSAVRPSSPGARSWHTATLRPATADALVSPRSATTSPTRQGTAWTLGLGLPPLLGGSTSVATSNYVLSLMHVWLKPFYFLQSSHKSVNLRSGQMEGAILLEVCAIKNNAGSSVL